MFTGQRSAPSPKPAFHRFALVSLLTFAALNGFVLWHFRSPVLEGYGDFASFYTAGNIVRAGQSARLYDPKLQWQVQQQFAANVKIRVGPLPYIRPPFEALLFVPFSLFSYRTACVMWFALKVALLVLVSYLAPFPPGFARSAASIAWRALLCFSFFPVGFDLLQGQDSVLVLVIVVAAFRLLSRRQDLASGMILGLGLFKFHIILPLFLIILLQKRVRFALGFVATGLTLFLISLGMVHWTGVLAYPKYLWLLNRVPAFGMVKPDSMPNVRA